MASKIECALMAGAAYESTRERINKIPKPEGWTPLDQGRGLDYRLDESAGFEAMAFQRGSEIVIAYAGTYDKSLVDKAADAALGAGLMNPQLFDAAKYYQDIRCVYPDASITLTGHSLGGGLAALVGVFFDQPAITFDPAPFRAAASVTNAMLLQTTLPVSASGSDPALSSFVYRSLFGSVNGSASIPGESRIQSYAVRGEALSELPWTLLRRVGPTPQFIDTNSPNVDGWDLHSIALLAAFEQSSSLRQATYLLPYVTQDLFDKTLFARDSDSAQRDLLTQMIRREFGIPGVAGSDADLLTHFAADAMKLGVFGAAPDALRRPLLAMAMQHDYQTVTGPASDFFTKVNGGLRFDLTQMGDQNMLLPNLSIRKYGELLSWILGNAPSDAGGDINNFLGDTTHRITLALGQTIEANTRSDDIADFMFAGTAGGSLASGAGNDLLVGRGSADMLNGGKGNDILIGGVGSDTYVWTTGDGNDRIIDTDMKGRILIDGEEAVALIRQSNSAWKSGDGKLTLSRGISWTLDIEGGGSIDLGGAFSSGDLGIHLYDETPASMPSRTILGDLAPIDFDATAPGAQTRMDDLGNVMVGSDPAPNREDVLQDSAGSDLIKGMGGNDFIASLKGGDDRIEGGDGDDWMLGGMGNDVVQGGAGRDVLVEGGGNDKLYADGIITVSAALAAENAAGSGLQGEALSGGSGDDLAIGTAGNDVLLGGLGDDILIAGAGDDNIEGDAMADNILADWSVTRNITASNGSTSYNASYKQFTMSWPIDGGNDVIYAGAGADWVTAGKGNDYVDGGNDNDVIWGDAGNDDLFGGSGADLIIGDNANLLLSVHGDDYLDGEDGDDSLYGEGGNDQMFGGIGADSLYGQEGDDTLDGEDGNDILLGGTGNDILSGGDGDDGLYGGVGADNIDGQAGNDVLLGGAGADELSGGDGADQLAGDNGGSDSSGEADTIYGGAGNDIIDGQGGDDRIDAGADNDIVAGGLGADQIAGGAGNDQLQGGADNDSLDGGEGNDTLFGQTGNDTLVGGAGTDYLIGGLGNDALDGGDGDDVYFYSTGDGNDRIVDSGGTDWLVFNDINRGQIILGVGSLKLSLPDGSEIHLDDFDPDNPYAAGGIEYFQFADGSVASKGQLISALGISPTGTPDADVLSGTGLSETIRALAGDDVVTARAGNDVIYAGDGNDVLLGEAGNDTLYGEAGNDLLSGGAGTDQLQGGEGDDTYLFQLGDGQDAVIDGLGNNAIMLGAGLTQDAIVFSRAGDDLLVSVKNASDRLTVRDWFGAANHIGSLSLADGTLLDHAGVEAAMPRNRVPLAVMDSATLTEDSLVLVTGNALDNDSDPEGRALRVTNPGSYAGTVGTLSLASNGTYTYSLVNESSAVQSLASGQSLTDTFAYTVSDDDPGGAATAEANIRITVRGANDLPVLGADSTSTDEDAAPISGNLLTNDHDVDAGTTLTIANPGTKVGAYGTLNLAADGAYSYSASNAVQALAAGQTVMESFAQSVSDGSAQVVGTLQIRIVGRNDAPIVARPLADQSAAANTSWSWQVPAGSFTDVDAGDVLGYGATLASGAALPSWLAFSAATQTFSGRVPKSATGSIDIRVAATDRVGAATTDAFALVFGAGSGGGGGGNGGNDGGGGQGNEGVGNGADAPPPGHDESFNDGAGTGPGNPGATNGNGYRPPHLADIVFAEVKIASLAPEEQAAGIAAHGNSVEAHAAEPGQVKQASAELSRPADTGMATSTPIGPADWLTDAAWAYLDHRKSDASYEAAPDVDTTATFVRWLVVEQALARESSTGIPDWLDRAKGADLRGLLAANGGLLGADQILGTAPVSLLANAGLKSFTGLAVPEGTPRSGFA